jgi:hypothetical protein
MGKYIEIYIDDQALESTELPERSRQTPFPILAEMGTKAQPASPMNYFGTCTACLQKDVLKPSAPTMHAILPFKSKSKTGDEKTKSEILKQPFLVKDHIHSLLVHGNKAKEEGLVTDVWRKLGFINAEIHRLCKARPFVKNIVRIGNQVKITFDDTRVEDVTTMLDRFIVDDERLGVPTPRGYVLQPLGVGGADRVTSSAKLSGHVGSYELQAPDEPLLGGRYAKLWTLQTFIQGLYLLPLPGGRIYEETIIMDMLAIETWQANGLDTETIWDIIQILPWWSLWCTRPNLLCYKPDPVAMSKWISQVFVFGRSAHMMNSVGINTFIRDRWWNYNNPRVSPGEKYFENCFNQGQYRTKIDGIRSFFLWPGSSAHLHIGEIQIMADSHKKKNFWSSQTRRNNLETRSQPVFLEDRNLIVPNLVDEQKDAMILSLEPQMKRARLEEIFRKESLPPNTIFYGKWQGPATDDLNWNHLFRTLLMGGTPLFTWDVLIESMHHHVSLSGIKSVVPKDLTLERELSRDLAIKMQNEKIDDQKYIIKTSNVNQGNVNTIQSKTDEDKKKAAKKAPPPAANGQVAKSDE